MEERSSTTHANLSLNHALVRRNSGGLSPLTTVHTKTAAAGALRVKALKRHHSFCAPINGGRINLFQIPNKPIVASETADKAWVIGND